MTIQTTLVVQDSERRIGWDIVALNQIPLTQVGSYSSSFTVDVGTTEETLSFGDITPGKIVMANLDATNFVEWGYSAGNRPGRLDHKVATTDECGDPNVITVSGATIFVKADTAACKIKVWVYQA
jgi:hypothetical protein